MSDDIMPAPGSQGGRTLSQEIDRQFAQLTGRVRQVNQTLDQLTRSARTFDDVLEDAIRGVRGLNTALAGTQQVSGQLTLLSAGIQAALRPLEDMRQGMEAVGGLAQFLQQGIDARLKPDPSPQPPQSSARSSAPATATATPPIVGSAFANSPQSPATPPNQQSSARSSAPTAQLVIPTAQVAQQLQQVGQSAQQAGQGIVQIIPLGQIIASQFAQLTGRTTTFSEELERSSRTLRGGDADAKKRGEVDARNHLTLNQWMQRSSRSLLAFTQSLVPIQTTAGGATRQVIEAGAPTAMSTLTKTWRLLNAQLTGAFIPTISEVIAKLQDFADWLKVKRESGEDSGIKAGTVAALVGMFMPGGLLVKGLAAGVSGGLTYFADKRSKEQEKEQEDAKVQRWLGVVHGMSDASQQVYDGKHGPELEKYFRENLNKQDGYKGFAKLPNEIQEALRKAGLANRFTAYDEALAKKTGGKAYLADNAPGYQPRYSGFGDFREQLQIESLSKSPLDMELLKLEKENHIQIIDRLQRIAENTDRRDLGPPRG